MNNKSALETSPPALETTGKLRDADLHRFLPPQRSLKTSVLTDREIKAPRPPAAPLPEASLHPSEIMTEGHAACLPQKERSLPSDLFSTLRENRAVLHRRH